MNRTSPLPKTNIPTVATALGTALFAVWLATFAGRPASLYAAPTAAPAARNAPADAARVVTGERAVRTAAPQRQDERSAR